MRTIARATTVLLGGCALLLLQFGCPGLNSGDRVGPVPQPSSADAGRANGTDAATIAPPAPDQNTPDWVLSSTAFTQDERMPLKYTGDGDNMSPPLTWTAPPTGTQELALICEDPDAPDGVYTQWLVYGMAPTLTGLPENVVKVGELGQPALKQGFNSAHQVGYTGPKPPPGKLHHYQFTLYALSAPLYLRPNATKADLQMVMEGNILGQTQIEATYSE